MRILAEKIHALIKRNNTRDLYDLFFLLRFVEFDEQIVKKKLEIFKMKFDRKVVKKKIEDVRLKWEAELRPFLLTELPEFDVVKSFVEEKLKIK